MLTGAFVLLCVLFWVLFVVVDVVQPATNKVADKSRRAVITAIDLNCMRLYKKRMLA